MQSAMYLILNICILFFIKNAHAQLSPKIVLKKSSAPQVISLKDALARAEVENTKIVVAKEQTQQQKARLTRAWSAYLPKLTLEGITTFNFPEIKVSLANGSQNMGQAQLFESTADLLELTGPMRTDAIEAESALAQAAQFRQAALELRRSRSTPIIINPGVVFDAKLILSQPIFNLESIMAIKGSSLETKKNELNLKRTQTVALIEVARTYLEAIRTSRLIDIARHRHARASAQVKQMKDKHAMGFARMTDLQRVEIELAKANESVLQAQINHSDQLADLGLLIGQDEVFLLDSRAITTHIENQNTNELIKKARSCRDDLRAAELAVKIAENAESIAWATFFPTLSVVGQGKYTSNTSGFVNKPFTGAILLQASISVFDGGDRYGRLRENRSKIREERAKLRELEHRIDAEIQGALATIDKTSEVLALSERLRSLNRSVYIDMASTFKSGLADISDLIDANQRLSDAEIDVENARLDLELARLELMSAIGELKHGVS